MRRKLHISILLFVILFPTGLECHGALKFRAVEGGNYAWLLDQAINCIAQDSHNFLWISTYGGLLRYDGATFQLMAHDPSDPGSIADNNAGKLLPDPERGGIWVATNAGLDYFDPVSGSFFHAIPGIYSKDMLFLGERILCCSGSKVFLCSESKGSISFAPIDIGIVPISMCDYDEGRFLAADHEGLYLLDKATFKVLSFAPSPSSTYSHSLVYYSRVADKIYVGNSIGTKSAVFSCRDGQLVKEDSFVPDNLHAVCDIDGKTLFGTNGNGLYILDNGTVSRMTVKDGLSSDVVTAFCYDTRGDLWLGLYRGGLMLNHKMMEPFSVIKDFKMVSSIIPTDDIIYAGTDSYGLGIVDRKSGRTRILNTSNSGIPGNNVVSMTLLDDEIWMAVYTKGLTSYNIKTGRFKTWSLDGQDAQYVDNNKTWIVRHDDRGRIWVGGPSLFLFARESQRFIKVAGFENVFISAIHCWGYTTIELTRGLLVRWFWFIISLNALAKRTSNICSTESTTRGWVDICHIDTLCFLSLCFCSSSLLLLEFNLSFLSTLLLFSRSKPATNSLTSEAFSKSRNYSSSECFLIDDSVATHKWDKPLNSISGLSMLFCLNAALEDGMDAKITSKVLAGEGCMLAINVEIV